MGRSVDERIFIEVLRRYQLKRSSVSLISSSESWVFQIASNPSSYILRLTPSSHRPYEMIRAEIDWINYLYSHGLRVARAIRFRGRELVEMVVADDTYVSAVVFEKAKGYTPGYTDLDSDLIREWGNVVGRMHALARNYRPKDPIYSRAHWDQDDKFDIRRYIPRSQTTVFERFDALVTRLRKLPRDSMSYGLIHADLNPDNFFVNEQGQITVFDFDDCLYSWFLYDITAIVFAMVENSRRVKCREQFVYDFLSAFCDGYSKANSVEDLTWNAWFDLLKLQEFERYITIHRLPELRRCDPSEYERLRYNIENDIPYLDVRFM